MRCVTLAICVFIAPCAIDARMPKDKDPEQIGRRKVGGVNLYSLSHEAELGRELARDVEREVRIVADPVLAEYVNRIGQNLAHNSDSRFLFTVKIIRSEEINAFTLPGGHVYITTGLIRTADNEAELASALSHEIAHVAARHYTHQASLEQIVGVASIPLLFIGGWPGFVIQHGMEVATPLALRKTSRMAEAQADKLGMQYLYQTGYDPTSFIDFFERIAQGKDSHTGLFAKLLESHPGLQSRIRAAQKQLQNDFAPRSRYLIQTSEFEVMKHRLTDIEKGTAVPWPRHRVESFDTPPVLRRRD
jgi:beta-barrel assembly-enhancing protease